VIVRSATLPFCKPATLVLSVTLALASGCRGRAPEALTATASDEWTRSYPLSVNGTVVITNARGSVDVEAGDSGTVDVRAERIVRAATDAMAREVLPRMTFTERIAPEKIVVVTERLSGILVGIELEVRYRVRAPPTASIEVRTADGPVTVSGFSGRVGATATNGPLRAVGLSGGLAARTTNGMLTVDLAAVGGDLVELRATNGHVHLTLPPTADATLLATATNGRVDVEGLRFETAGEPQPRRVRGRINGGGTPIEITATNGSIRVAAADSVRNRRRP
jgi:hypothetical protein